MQPPSLYRYYHFSKRIHSAPKDKHIAERMSKVKEKTVKTEKCKIAGTLACGMMLKREEDYEFFKTYFTNNHLFLRSCNSLRMNTKETLIDNTTNMFSPKGGFFRAVLYYSLTMIVLMTCVGIFFEGKRYIYQGRI